MKETKARTCCPKLQSCGPQYIRPPYCSSWQSSSALSFSVIFVAYILGGDDDGDDDDGEVVVMMVLS